jgi:hypothetical protein
MGRCYDCEELQLKIIETRLDGIFLKKVCRKCFSNYVSDCKLRGWELEAFKEYDNDMVELSYKDFFDILCK